MHLNMVHAIINIINVINILINLYIHILIKLLINILIYIIDGNNVINIINRKALCKIPITN